MVGIIEYSKIILLRYIQHDINWGDNNLFYYDNNVDTKIKQEKILNLLLIVILFFIILLWI